MGARALLRIAGVALVCAPAAAQPRITVGLIDVRAASADAAPRERMAAALAARREVEAVRDTALATALAGERDRSARAAAEEIAGRAEVAPCPVATGFAQEATAALLAVDDPEAAAAPLARALRAELRCADAAGDRAAAQRAASRIRALGGDLGDLADRYPEIDAASNVSRQPITVRTEPPGARVWIDFVFAGAAPVDKTVAPGPHLVVAAAPGGARGTATFEAKENKGGAFTLKLVEPPTDPHEALRARVAAWRGGAPVTAEGIALTMREAGIGLAVVWSGPKAQVWALTDKGIAAPAAEVEPADPGTAAAAAARAAGGGEAPKDAKPGRSPWIYIVALGAAGAALGVVLLSENASRTQRIEVKWP